MKASKLILFVLALAGVSCGSSPASPPSAVSVAGTWAGTQVLTSVSGGDCFAPTYAFYVGVPFPVFPFVIAQTSDNLAMNFTLVFSSNTCPFAGVATATGFTLAASNCATFSPSLCEGSRLPRDVSFVSATFSGTVSGNTASATQIETWNVYVSGTQTSVGPLTLTTRRNLTR